MKKDFTKFEKWLKEKGASILAPTNDYEILRFKTRLGLHVIYKRKSGLVTMQGHARTLYENFEAGKHIDLTPFEARTDRPNKSKKDKLVEAILKRDGRECFYCGQEISNAEMSLEHILSINHGGTNHISNLCLAHKKCNEIAGHMSIVDKIKLRETMRGKEND